MVSDAAVVAGNEQVPDAFANVMVTVWPDPTAVALQLAKPVGSVIAGAAGTVGKPVKTAVIVDPATSAPVELGVNPSVYVEASPPPVTEGVNVTPVGVTAVVMVRGAETEAESAPVATATVVVAAGLVTPPMVTVPAVLAASVQSR